jgi:hypothetical protein
MAFADKVTSIIQTSILANQNTLMSYFNQQQNNGAQFVGQVDADSFIYGAGSNLNINQSNATLVAAFTGSRYLRPNDVVANVGGRVF